MSTPSSAGETRPQRPVAELWRIIYPLVVTNAAQVLITVVDTVLLARFATSALAAVALAVPVYLVAVMVVRGWATAVQIVVARRFGALDRDGVAGVTAAGLVAGVLTGTGVGGVLFLVAPSALLLLGGDPALAASGADYLRILAVAVPFAAATFILQGAYAGLGATRIAMVMTLLVNAVNLVLGLLLIFGLGLGVVGAGLASLVSTVAGTAFMTWYGRRRFTGELVLLRRRDLRGWRTATPALWRLAWPEATLLFLGYLNEVLLIGFVAQLGEPELGAYRLLDNLTLVIYTLVAAGSTGVTITVGQHLGAGRITMARTCQRAGLAVTATLAAVPAMPVLLLPGSVYALLTPDRAVVDLAVGPTWVAVLGLVPLVLALNLAGVLRAAGDNRTVMRASLIGDYAVLVPLAWLLGVHLGWGLHGIFVAWLGFGLVVLALVHRKYRVGTWRTSTV